MDILRIFKMQEPVSKELLSKKNDVGTYKECVQEKDVILRNQKEKIKDLEEHINDLKSRNLELESIIQNSGISVKETGNGESLTNQFQNTLEAYENFISDIMQEKEQFEIENQNLMSHIDKLDDAFKKLLAKYDKAKGVVQGLKSNEEILQQRIADQEALIKNLTKKCDFVKKHFPHKKNTSYSAHSIKSVNGVCISGSEASL